MGFGSYHQQTNRRDAHNQGLAFTVDTVTEPAAIQKMFATSGELSIDNNTAVLSTNGNNGFWNG